MLTKKYYMYGTRVIYSDNRKFITHRTELRCIEAKSEREATLKFIENHFNLICQFRGGILEFYMLNDNQYVKMSIEK